MYLKENKERKKSKKERKKRKSPPRKTNNLKVSDPTGYLN